MNFKTLEVAGWEPALYGMRFPLKSLYKADSYYDGDNFIIGPNDYNLAKKLWKAGPEHRKYLRQIQVWVKISAPRYWWSEFDTYKIGTSANSFSTMHKILTEDFDQTDFEWMFEARDWDIEVEFRNYLDVLKMVRDRANDDPKYKEHYQQLLKCMLPESFIQTRAVNLNYEVLATMYHQRKNHRLPQWSKDFVEWTHTLPYSEFITGRFDE